MKAVFLEVLQNLSYGLIELLIFFPVVLIAGILLIPSSLLWLWIFSLPIFYLSGISICITPVRRWKLICLLAGTLLTAIITFPLFGFNALTVVAGIIEFYIFYRGMLFMQVSWNELFPPTFFWVGLLAYFAAYFIFSYVERFQSFLPLITYAGVTSIAVYLFILNTVKLKFSSKSGGKKPSLPASLVRHNRITIIITFLAICLISSFNLFSNLKDGITWLAAKIFSFIAWIIHLLSKPITYAPQGHVQAPPTPMPADVSGPSPFDNLFKVLGIIFLIAAVIFLVYIVVKPLIKLLRRMVSVLLKPNSIEEVDAGYEDKEENMMDWEKLKKDYAQLLAEKLANMLAREPDWKDLKDNGERIRYIYRHLLLRCMAAGYTFKQYLTPNETVADITNWDQHNKYSAEELIPLYNQVRYSNKDVDDKDMEKITETLLKKLK